MPANRADIELAVPAGSIKPTREGWIIMVKLRGVATAATVTDIGIGEIGAVTSKGQTVLVREVGRNAAVRA